MTATLPAPPAGRSRLQGLVDRVAGVLDHRTSRRGFLSKVAVVGSAVAVGPAQYALRPGTAYASVCGIDSSCTSGYTVFCATINGGVNRCPPNSLVGGWWKADGSGFCCGSARYYIDCHSYCSCGCGGTAKYCSRACTSCGSATCGPGGQCDQRKVCTNNFRYGQCMQHVSCTGPVWCRVVTCTPPWRVGAWRCTSTSATDNRTGQHSAPALPSCTPIDQKFTALGGQGGLLGELRSRELAAAGGGRYCEYDRGSIYWSSGTGAHEVHGLVRQTWLRLGGPAGVLGYPVTDESASTDGVGRYNHFRGAGGDGSVFYSPGTGAHAVWGLIRQRWVQLGAERGVLGYPTTSESASTDGVGRYNHFRGPGGEGSIFYSPGTGAHAVWGLVRQRWVQLGAERGVLGYPTTSETRTLDGTGSYNHFRGPGGVGSIFWSPSTGAHAVWGRIRQTWVELGAQRGVLGYPVTSERAVPGGRGRYNDFVGRGTASAPAASVYYSGQTGAVSVRGPVRARWLAEGGAPGALGFPVSEPVIAGGVTRQEFEGGRVEHDAATGQTTVTTGEQP